MTLLSNSVSAECSERQALPRREISQVRANVAGGSPGGVSGSTRSGTVRREPEGAPRARAPSRGSDLLGGLHNLLRVDAAGRMNQRGVEPHQA